MKPIFPFLIPEEELKDESWTSNPVLAANICHIRNVCADFPSLLLGYSADSEAKIYSDFITSVITNKWGLNVFLQEDAVPLPALSYAITTRSMPIGLYIEKASDSERPSARVTLISTHGGLFNEKDLRAESVSKPSKPGVVGTTDILSSYVKQLVGFADPYIDDGVCFADLEVPFTALSKMLKAKDSLALINDRQIKGPVARLSNNGCYVDIYNNNEKITFDKLAYQLAKHLKEERLASGSIFVPKGKGEIFSALGDISEVEENESVMSYFAGFADLFIAWWPEKLIALQGSSCFGDGLLASIYYIESMR